MGFGTDYQENIKCGGRLSLWSFGGGGCSVVWPIHHHRFLGLLRVCQQNDTMG